MLPVLNRDLLTAIVKQLLEDGDQNAVIQFGLSGKQPLQALVNVFASVTNLELYDDYYAIGLDGRKCCSFYYKDEEANTREEKKQHSRSLMLCIGDSVINLRMDCGKEASLKYYQPFFDKIIAKKQLSTFSVPRCYNQCDAMKFIQTFSSTLTDVAINPLLLNDSIRDSLKLEKLTILLSNDIFFYRFCPQTSILNFESCNSSTFKGFHDNFTDFFSNFGHHASPFLASVNELVFKDDVGGINENVYVLNFKEYCKVFSSLQHIKFYMDNTVQALSYRFDWIKNDINQLKKIIIRDALNVPLKVTYITKRFGLASIDFYKAEFKDYEYVDTVENVYCFRQMIGSAGSETTRLEIQVEKSV